MPRPGETPDVMRPDHGPAQAAIDAKQGAKQKQGKKGRPARAAEGRGAGENRAACHGAPKTETAKETPGDDAPSLNAKSETAKVDAPKEVGQRAACDPSLIQFRR